MVRQWNLFHHIDLLIKTIIHITEKRTAQKQTTLELGLSFYSNNFTQHNYLEKLLMTRLKYKNIQEHLHEQFIDVLAEFSAHREVRRGLCLPVYIKICICCL